MRLWFFIFGCCLCIPGAMAQDEENIRRWSLELPAGFPEGFGVNLQSFCSPRFSLNLFYHTPTELTVKTAIKSRKLVDKDGFMIRSPSIDLPFRVRLGPHHGIGASYRPFASPFFVMLAWESRLVTIESRVQSHLEVIDAENRMMTHTLFHAAAFTRTQQSLWRPSFAWRWDIGETDYFFSLYSGWSRPYQAHSSVRTLVRVRNPEASHPGEVDARNLEDAEAAQERSMEQKVVHELRKFEKLTLPVFGISLGKFL